MVEGGGERWWWKEVVKGGGGKRFSCSGMADAWRRPPTLSTPSRMIRSNFVNEPLI